MLLRHGSRHGAAQRLGLTSQAMGLLASGLRMSKSRSARSKSFETWMSKRRTASSSFSSVLQVLGNPPCCASSPARRRSPAAGFSSATASSTISIQKIATSQWYSRTRACGDLVASPRALESRISRVFCDKSAQSAGGLRPLAEGEDRFPSSNLGLRPNQARLA